MDAKNPELKEWNMEIAKKQTETRWQKVGITRVVVLLLRKTMFPKQLRGKTVYITYNLAIQSANKSTIGYLKLFDKTKKYMCRWAGES